MSIKNFTEYNLPKSAYATFEADSLKSLIIDRLRESDVFKDQSFEGSNINALIDVVAYMYHVLLFYLNTTASESNFSTATLYENMSKIVSLLNYKPRGRLTSIANITLETDSSVPLATYTIKRFSFIAAGNIKYSTIKDITFEKTNYLDAAVFIDNSTLLQGTILESPTYTGMGENYEVVTLINPYSDSSLKFIADNSFTVFVQDINNKMWYEWQEVSSLFLESPTSLVYEKRIDENGNYTFKFGNNITGKALTIGDSVKIFYVLSDGEAGLINANTLNNYKFNLYNSPSIDSILNDLNTYNVQYISATVLSHITPINSNDSTPITSAETVDEIRENVPKMLSSQNRLVTAADYEFFIASQYNNIVRSTKVISNDEYASSFLKYFYSIGINKPNDNCRVLLNQVNFATASNFNSVYLFCIPKISPILAETRPNYLNLAQKQLLTNACNSKKDITHNIVHMDPIFKAASFGLQLQGEEICVDIKDKTVLVVKIDRDIRVSSSSVKSIIVKLFTDHFNSMQLGGNINIRTLNDDILNIEGVVKVSTRRIDTSYETTGVHLIIWNPIYDVEDITITSQSYALEKYMYAFLYESSNLHTKIIVEDE